MKKETLFVSETFYSIQGEGSTMGLPAVFLRLGGCNLLCGGRVGVDADWRCDTIEVWRKGVKKEFINVLTATHVLQLKNGVHLIITGGEPLIQQDMIQNYLRWFLRTYKFLPKVEIETNGTFYPSIGLRPLVYQWNCSPKLENSGEKYTDRIDKSALGAIDKERAIFKFVISTPTDWIEIVSTFLNDNTIRKDKIWLMPAASNIKELLAANKLVAKMAMTEQVKFCTRLQVEIWNKTVGV